MKKGFYIEIKGKKFFIEHKNYYLKDSEARLLMLRFNKMDIRPDAIETFRKSLRWANLYQTEGHKTIIQIGRNRKQEIDEIEIIRSIAE